MTSTILRKPSSPQPRSFNPGHRRRRRFFNPSVAVYAERTSATVALVVAIVVVVVVATLWLVGDWWTAGRFFSSFLVSIRSSSSKNHPWCSLWLVPPPEPAAELRSVITGLAAAANDSVPFPPHITLVGGFPCPPSPHQWIESLQTRIAAEFRPTRSHQDDNKCFAGVDCHLQTSLQSMASLDDDDGDKLVWSQALVAVVDQSPSLLQLVDTCRRMLQIPATTPMFPPPLGQPHLSLLYTLEKSSLPTTWESLLPPHLQQFRATRVELWQTTPMSVEGVQYWWRVHDLELPTTQCPPNNHNSL